MSGPTPEQRPAPAPQTLDYHSASTPVPPTPGTSRLRTTVLVMAWAWPLVMGLAGVSGDFTYIPLGKKFALSASAVVIWVLLIATGDGRRFGCAGWFVLVALCMAGVMWFWN